METLPGDAKTMPRWKIVAMLGQIPAKVSSENGAIMPGDSLTSAIQPGYLRKANPGESNVGLALELFPSGEGFDRELCRTGA